MTEDAAIVIGIKGDTSGGVRIRKTLDDIANSGDRAIGVTTGLNKTFTSIKSASVGLAGAFTGLIAAMGLRELGRISDQYTTVNARLNTITGSTGAASAAMRDLKRISSETGSAISSSLDILQRLSFVRKEIDATNRDMLNFTETVTKLGVLSNASNDAMRNGLTQLGQSLSSEIMRAEEFNSIMENIPSVGKAIADQFGVTTGQLRQLVINGEVLSKDVFAAILNQSEKVSAEMAEMPKTIERAGKESGITFDALIAKIMNTTDANQGYVKIIEFGNERLKEMVATVDIIRLSFEFMGNRIGVTFNNIAYEIQQIYNKASVAIHDLTGGRVDLGIKSDVFKLGYDQTIDQFNTAKANAVRSAMGEQYGPNMPQQTRDISKNYSEIATKIGQTTKLTKEQREAVKAQKKIQDDLTDAIKDSRTESEKLYDKIADMEKLSQNAKTPEQFEAIAQNIKNAQDELEKLRIKAELESPTAKAFASLASEIDDGFKDAFKSAFTESDGDLKKMLNGWKSMIMNFLAELAYQVAARPIVVSLVGAVGGLMGLSGGAVNSVLGNVTGAPGILGGGTSGLSSIGSIGSLFSGAKNILTGGYSATLGNIGGSIGQGIGGLFGMDQYSAIALGDKFAGIFGNAGLGSLGALGANLFGLGSGNGLVDAGLGTAGSLLGSAFGGPIGALAGGFLGTALGGLFGGGKPSDKSAWGTLDLATLAQSNIGNLSGKKYSAENVKFRDAALGEAATLAQLFQSVGATTTGTISTTIGNRDGLRLTTENGTQNFGRNSDAFVKAMMEAVLKGTTGLTGTFKQIVDKLGVGDTAKLGKAFEFGKIYDEFTKSKDPVDILKESLDALNKQLEDLQKQAIELGFPTDKLTEAYNKQKEVILGSIKAQMAGFTSLEEMTKAYKSFLDGQALGDNSSLSPMQKLQLAQDNFGSLLSKAQGGDYSVTQELLKAASQLLDIGRGVYASSVSFAGLEQFVRSSVTEIARASGVPGYAVGTNNAAAGLAWVGEKGPELVRMRGGEQVYTNSQSMSMVADHGRSNGEIVSLLGDILEESRASRRESERSRKLMESVRNKLAVNS